MNSVLESTNDLEVGVNLDRALGLASYEVADPSNMVKIREIAEYLNNHPDPNFLISTLKRSAGRVQTRPIDHFLSYVELQNQKTRLTNQLASLDKEIQYYE